MITFNSIIDKTPTQSGKLRVRVLLSRSDGNEVCEMLYLPEGTDEAGILSVITLLVAKLNSYENETAIIEERNTKRSILRAKWDNLPTWLVETFNPAFDSVNALLDLGKIGEASNLIALFQPLVDWNSEQRNVFEIVKSQFILGINNL
jgi:hypothetical protein